MTHANMSQVENMIHGDASEVNKYEVMGEGNDCEVRSWDQG